MTLYAHLYAVDEGDGVTDVADFDEMCTVGFLAVEGPLQVRTAFEGETGGPEKAQGWVIIMMGPQGRQDLVQDDEIRREGDEQSLEEAVIHMDFAVFQLQDAAEGR